MDAAVSDPLSGSYTVDGSAHAFFMGAMRAAEERTAGFDAVADDLAAAMITFGRDRVNGAFEAIEKCDAPSIVISIALS